MKEIDNAGGGDCGPYAFSIALIHIIQNEYLNQNESPTFSNWQKEGLERITLEEILDVNLNTTNRNRLASKYDNLLYKLQMSIRHIAAESKKNDLINNIRREQANPDLYLALVESSNVFANFSELVNAYLNKISFQKTNNISQFNELALSDSVKKLAENTAEIYKPGLEDNDFSSQDITINSIIKQVMSEDVGKANSVILQGIDALKQPGRWLTHTDMQHVAGVLKVNLFVNGQNNGRKAEDQPTVTLNNKNNAHWTTSINSSLDAALDNRLDVKIERIIESTASSQADIQKANQYKKHLELFITSALKKGFFDRVSNKIDLNKLDEAQASVNENSETQSDELFALQLQEAEFRRAGLI